MFTTINFTGNRETIKVNVYSDRVRFKDSMGNVNSIALADWYAISALVGQVVPEGPLGGFEL